MKRFMAALALSLSAAPGFAADGADDLTAGEARATALDFADKLEDGFLDPVVGRAYARDLRAKAESGAYDGFSDPETFAAAATEDVQAVHPDGHLKLRFDPSRGQAEDHGAAAEREPRPNVGDTRWIADGVAYTEWFEFPGNDDELSHARRIMEEYEGADAIIFDIRKHRGGGLAEMDVFFSYLFDKPTHLVTMKIREDKGAMMAEAFDETPSLHRKSARNGVNAWEHWTSPVASDTAWRDAKVYVLTSDYTASAAEHFALALKASGRGKLIGEATRGAGNFGSSERIGERFSAFIPVGQTIDPATGEGWEGVGVAPDIEIDADKALERAREAAKS